MSRNGKETVNNNIYIFFKVLLGSKPNSLTPKAISLPAKPLSRLIYIKLYIYTDLFVLNVYGLNSVMAIAFNQVS